MICFVISVTIPISILCTVKVLGWNRLLRPLWLSRSRAATLADLYILRGVRSEQLSFTNKSLLSFYRALGISNRTPIALSLFGSSLYKEAYPKFDVPKSEHSLGLRLEMAAVISHPEKASNYQFPLNPLVDYLVHKPWYMSIGPTSALFNRFLLTYTVFKLEFSMDD